MKVCHGLPNFLTFISMCSQQGSAVAFREILVESSINEKKGILGDFSYILNI